MKIRGRCLSAFKPSSCLDSMHKKSKSKNRFPTINSILVQACLYICIFFGCWQEYYICPEISSTVPWNKLSFLFRGFPWNPVCYKDKPDSAWPKTDDSNPHGLMESDGQEMVFLGFVRGCVHGTHSWQLLSLGSMLKAVYFQLETWVSNPNRLLSTTGGLRQQTTGGYTVCTWYPLASFPLTKWHV